MFKINRLDHPKLFCWLLFACCTAASQVFKTGFLSLSKVGFWVWIILYCGSFSRVFEVWQHPWPLTTRCQRYPPIRDNKNVSQDIAECAPGSKITPS